MMSLKQVFKRSLDRISFEQLAGQEVENDNELHKHLLQKEKMEHLQDGQLQNKKQQHQITTQLQQNLYKNKKLVINQEIDKKSFTKKHLQR